MTTPDSAAEQFHQRYPRLLGRTRAHGPCCPSRQFYHGSGDRQLFLGTSKQEPARHRNGTCQKRPEPTGAAANPDRAAPLPPLTVLPLARLVPFSHGPCPILKISQSVLPIHQFGDDRLQATHVGGDEISLPPPGGSFELGDERFPTQR